MVLEKVVKQYVAYCADSGFNPVSWSTLLRILAVCPASTRKSLQGIYYVTPAGAKAFEDLADAVERLGDAGQGMGWSKNMNTRTRLYDAKRYLKSDYKVDYYVTAWCFLREGNGMGGSRNPDILKQDIYML